MKHFGYRIDEERYRKFKYVCAYEGKSINKAINDLIEMHIAEFEAANGKISADDLPELKTKKHDTDKKEQALV